MELALTIFSLTAGVGLVAGATFAIGYLVTMAIGRGRP